MKNKVTEKRTVTESLRRRKGEQHYEYLRRYQFREDSRHPENRLHARERG
jgi:hypothetical protein